MPRIKTKIIATVILGTLLFSGAPKEARADAWGANMAASILKQTMEMTHEKVQQTIVASLRTAAVRVIMGRVNTLLTGSPGAYGGGSSTLVIQDWREFVFGTAQRQASIVTNDFFNTVRSGIPMSVQKTVIQPAERALQGEIDEIIQPDIQNYVAEGKVARIFSPGYARDPWEAYRRSNFPQNSPAYWLFEGYARERAAYEQVAASQQNEGIAGQGFASQRQKNTSSSSNPKGLSSAAKEVAGGIKSTPKIINPGIIVKDLVAEIQLMPIKIMEFTNNIPELASNMASSMIAQLINQGLAMAVDPIDKELMKFNRQWNDSLSRAQAAVQQGINELPQKAGGRRY